MATTKVLIFFDSSDSTGQGVLVKEIAKLKYTVTDATVTVKDTVGLSAANIVSYINTLTPASYDDVVIAQRVDGTYMTYDIVALCDKLLKTAKKGTSVLAGTCGTNSTATHAILTGGSAVDDTYNGQFLKTTIGATTVYNHITDYTGSGTIAVITSNSPAITDTSTFVVYTNVHVHVLGEASSNEKACLVAWNNLFSGKRAPLIVSLLGGYGTGFSYVTEYGVTPTSVATTSGVSTLTHTSHFAATNSYKWYWLGIEAASNSGGAGYIGQILSNTVSVLTLDRTYRVVPTGTITYQICDNKDYCLASSFLPYAIATYLQLEDTATSAIWIQLLDMYNTRGSGNIKNMYKTDESVLKGYVWKGRSVFDAKSYGLVS